MTSDEIYKAIQRHYKSIEFTNDIKAIGLKELRKQQEDKGLDTLAHYIDSLYRKYQYSTK